MSINIRRLSSRALTSIVPLRFAASIAFAFAATQAFAHAELESSSPPVGGSVSSPSEIRLTFSEGVEPKFTKVSVSDPSGAVSVGAGRVEPGHQEIFVAPISGSLAPGAYKVHWQAVSVDSHHTQGTFAFTVK